MRKTTRKVKNPDVILYTDTEVNNLLKQLTYKPSKEYLAAMASLDRMRKLLNEW